MYLDHFLKVESITNGDFLTAISNIFDGQIDADWTGENEEEFWSKEAQELHKPDKEIVEERLSTTTLKGEDIVIEYIEEYKNRYGGYYDSIEYRVCYDNNDNPVSLVVSFVRAD